MDTQPVTAEPSLDQGLAADRYAAGRTEEHLHTAGVTPPSLATLQKIEYQKEVQALLAKIQTTMPSLLPWVETTVISLVNPQWHVQKIDAALEHIFQREPAASPRRAANEVAHYKRIPDEKYNYVWKRAQIVKRRIQKRHERAELADMMEDC
ncbi:MAG: hypothetical protein H8K03_22775 (plasmid) [Nitrospira sp.]